jgi:uncharacterized protein with HEPN domain
MRSDRDRLADIVEAISRIGEKLPDTKEEFLGSELYQVWALYHVQIIGEAANRISKRFQKAHPAIPWKDIIAMRHLLVHQYFGIDLDEVWNTAENDLPRLEQQVLNLLKPVPAESELTEDDIKSIEKKVISGIQKHYKHKD